jgi:DNA (cytosine-5)-methyltransferase 1
MIVRRELMKSIELFTGGGGLALGIHQAGFHHLVVVERNQDACATLRLNSARRTETGVEWEVAPPPGDVKHFDYGPYRDQAVDLLAGGAPCQPFSLGGKHAGDADSRNLFPEVFRAVRELRPRAFLLENVKGLTRQAFRPYFEYILDQLRFPFMVPMPGEGWEEHKARLDRYLYSGESDGEPLQLLPLHQCYDVRAEVVNVADFGVPQERHRVFVVGFRRDLGVRWHFPSPTHSEDALLYAQYVDGTYWTEHGLTPRPAPLRLAPRLAKLALRPKPMVLRWQTVRDAIKDLPEPQARIAHPGVDNHVGIPDARIYPGHTGSPWDWPAKAIKAGDHGNPGGENMLRREDGSVRYFTVRELARIQTFPDVWHFASTWTESRRQLGNAVPVRVAEIMARGIHEELVRVDMRSRLLATGD